MIGKKARRMEPKRESSFEMLARLIKQESESIRKEMATKADVASLYRMMATKEDTAHIRKDMTTKADLEETEERIITKLTPLEKAFDKDALTILDHGARIQTLEKIARAKH